MVRLLGIISLILALVLFPPAALAVVSNNAVPGDSTYPIKRGLENIIYSVASLNPNTQALFAKARSDRRFQEVVVLTSQGKGTGTALNELVEQTQIAASRIDKVTDATQKEKLISQLSESIAKYDAGLSQISQNTPEPIAPASTPTPTVTAPKPTETPQVFSTPAPSVAVSIATPVPTLPPPTPVPTTIIASVPTPAPSRDSDVDRARDELGRIRERLEKEKEKNQEKDKEKEKEREKEQEKKGNEGKKRD